MKSKTAILIAIILLVSLLLSGCEGAQNNTIVVTGNNPMLYLNAVERMMPEYTVVSGTGTIFGDIEREAACETFDVQAVPLVESNEQLYWYPQYLATAVIAIDRDKTDAVIRSWRDLTEISEEVSITDGAPYCSPMLAAISYALEGENYTLKETVSLLADISAEGRLIRNDMNCPVLLIFDYQAVELIEQGRELDIVIPSEGTLSFQKGLLSNEKLSFTGDVDGTLLACGLRTLGGDADEELYPVDEEYEKAIPAQNFRHMLDVTMRSGKTLRREVFHTRLFSSADGIEHNLFVLAFVALSVLWLGLALRRISQLSIRRILFISGILMIGWVMLRYFKYQIIEIGTVSRYCWYGYYVFQLALPLMMLALAWLLDNPNPLPRRAVKIICGIYFALLVAVLTNDLHRQVFIVDLSGPSWNGSYGYNWLYYAVFAASMLPVVVSAAILIKKAWGSPKRGAALLPLLFIVFLLIYGYGYVAGVPIARDSDFTVTASVFFLLYYQSAMISGLVPVNTQYGKLFALSPLRMQIVDKNGALLLASSSPDRLENDVWERLKGSFGSPVEAGENELFYADEIPSGAVVWCEDVSELSEMHRGIDENVRRLTASNALLSRELNTSRNAAALHEKARLSQMLESEIKEKANALSELIRALPEADDRNRQLGKIALLMCCIKRRCSLFFREQENNAVPADELAVFIDELSEIAGYAGVHLTTANGAEGVLTARYATLIYDFFYEVLNAAAVSGVTTVIESLEPCEGGVVMKLLLSSVVETADFLNRGLQSEILYCGGILSQKQLDGAFGIELSFHEGRV